MGNMASLRFADISSPNLNKGVSKCDDTCYIASYDKANNGDCEDGGTGASEADCEYGTDCTDCKTKSDYGDRYVCRPGTEKRSTTSAFVFKTIGPYCFFCGPGTYTNKTGPRGCVPCATGAYADEDGSTSCTQCPMGRYSGAQGSRSKDQCFQCPAGKHSISTGATSSASCTSCVVGKFSNETGMSECFTCAIGKSSNPPFRECSSLCPKGKYGMFDENKQIPVCANCTRGRYSSAFGASSNGTCAPCPPGQHGTGAGRVSFESGCRECSSGTFSKVVGAPDCKTCPAGKASATGQPVCISCLPGTKLVAGKCEACPVGTYSGILAATTCTSCPAGKFQDESGQLACKDGRCGTGTWGTGQASCADCPRNCNNCSRGTYNPSIGMALATDCLQCPLARYGATQGAKDLRSGCLLCPEGTFGETAGLLTSTCSGLCPLGTYSIPGLTQCLNCSARQFSNVLGSKSCTSCPEHETSDEGASACECEAGYYRSTAGKRCFPCPDDLDCSKKGSTLANVKLRPNTWRASITDNDFLTCPVNGTCIGGTDQGDYCLEGHHGPLCGICNHNYTRFQNAAPCTSCPKDMGLAIFWTILAVLLCAAALGLFLVVNRQVNAILAP